MALKFTAVVVATKENQTSSSGVPELLVHAPDGVTPDAVALVVDWLFKLEHVPLVGIAGKAVAPEQLSFDGGGGGVLIQTLKVPVLVLFPLL